MNISQSEITTMTVVENDSGLVKYAINSIIKFSPEVVYIIIAHNGSSKRHLNQIMADSKVQIVENPISRKIAHTSIRHGLGLNKIMPLVKTKYTAIVESDVILLSDKWWHMDDSYDFKTCVKAGRDGYPIKDINYWFMCFVLFKTDLFKSINWCPSQSRPFTATTDTHSNVYNDSGWEMASQVDKERAKCRELEYVKCKAGGKTKIFNGSFVYRSFELWEDGNPICAHYYRGSDLNLRPTRNLASWMKICDGVLK